MPRQIGSTEELERELAVLQSGTDSHQAGAVGDVSAKDPFVDPTKPPPPTPPKPEPPEPDGDPKPSATLRHP